MRLALFSALLLACAHPPAAAAQAPPEPPPAAAAADEAAIRDTLSRWYVELRKEREGRPWPLTAPGFIDASPAYRHVDTGARSLGPRVYTALAARALDFAWEVDDIRRDGTFAKVRVWERGYFYAWSPGRTYENAAATIFVLERQEKDGRWLILAHRTSGLGIPPNKITDPMPDLRDLFYATEGKDRDPQADARARARGR